MTVHVAPLQLTEEARADIYDRQARDQAQALIDSYTAAMTAWLEAFLDNPALEKDIEIFLSAICNRADGSMQAKRRLQADVKARLKKMGQELDEGEVAMGQIDRQIEFGEALQSGYEFWEIVFTANERLLRQQLGVNWKRRAQGPSGPTAQQTEAAKTYAKEKIAKALAG